MGMHVCVCVGWHSQTVSEHTLSFPERQGLWGNEPETSIYALILKIFLETTVTINSLDLLKCSLVYYISLHTRFTSLSNMINTCSPQGQESFKSPVHTENQNARLLSGMP